MSKSKTPRYLKDDEAKAVTKSIRVSPQKLQLVAAMIRNKNVAVALAELQFSRKRIALTVKKTLESAISNAENNHNLDIDRLVVKESYVGKAMVMKRFHVRGRGKASRVEKPFSHLTIIVKQMPDTEEAA